MSEQLDEHRAFLSGKYMNALVVEDKALIEARRQLNHAQTEYKVASHKYAAVRDLAAAHLGRNPYADEDSRHYNFPSEGRYRYLLMSPGDAAAQVLQESGSYLTLDEIAEALRDGGLKSVDSRTVHAALMQGKNVKKSSDGRYKYEAVEVIFE